MLTANLSNCRAEETTERYSPYRPIVKLTKWEDNKEVCIEICPHDVKELTLLLERLQTRAEEE